MIGNLAQDPPLRLRRLRRFLIRDSKRSHLGATLKIAQMSRYNGLMTPSEKNFVQRVQISQMVTDDPYLEDFYYQVHAAIRQGINPSSQGPKNNFEQTYAASGTKVRRAENPMQTQVMRAVQHAKARPKASQLQLEGTLGKISFRNLRAPKTSFNVRSEYKTDCT